jgi:hypothetical protein
MTPEEIFATLALKSEAKTPEQWADFFAMDPELQEDEARLIKDAVYEKDGPSVFSEIVSFVGSVLAPGITEAAGFASGYSALKAAL